MFDVIVFNIIMYMDETLSLKWPWPFRTYILEKFSQEKTFFPHNSKCSFIRPASSKYDISVLARACAQFRVCYFSADPVSTKPSPWSLGKGKIDPKILTTIST